VTPPSRISGPVHTRSALAVAWVVIALCFVLDVYGAWMLSRSAAIGARFAASGDSVVVSEVDRDSALYQAGIRPGARVLSIAGQPVIPSSFIVEPEDFTSYAHRDQFWQSQRQFGSAVSQRSIEITFLTRRGLRAVTVPVWPLVGERP